MDIFALVIPAFIAGLFTFLAPCTLPLVPGYLSFISGVSLDELKDKDKVKDAKRKILINGALFVIGFSAVFIIMGSLLSLGGIALAKYRFWLERMGGVFVIFFGLFMLGAFKMPFLNALQTEHKLKFPKWLKPGNPSSSVVFGTTFAVGWSPCVGPVLGAILTLAATSGSVLQGAFLLLVFSLGLGIPFLLIAATIGSASAYLNKISKYLHAIEIIGGIFLIVLGGLILFDKLQLFISLSYGALEFINYDRLYDFL